MPAPNPSFEQSLIATLGYTIGSFQDMTTKGSPLLGLIKKNGMYQSYTGSVIEQDLIFGEYDAYSYSGYDLLPTAPVDLLSKATFQPKQEVVMVVMNGRQITENMGENRRINLVKTHIDKAKAGAQNAIYRQMYGDGTGNGGKDLTGLRAMFPDNPAVGMYGGINRANWTWWRPGVYDVSNGDFPGYTTLTADSIMPILRMAMSKHTVGQSGPDILVGSTEWASALYAKLDAMQIIAPKGDTAELGFNTIRINVAGKTIDFQEESGIGSQMPANTLYGLDSKGLTLRYHANRNWKVDETRRPVNQDAIAIPILWMGEFIMTNPRTQFKITI